MSVSPRPFGGPKDVMGDFAGDFVGAFADAGILFPLLAALAAAPGFSPAVLLGTAGLAYLWAGWRFRIPMAVQPLKAIAIAAVAAGASAAEVRLAGALLGAFCLLLARPSADRIARRIPRSLVHGMQLGLGILLMLKGLQPWVASTGLGRYLMPLGVLLLIAGTEVSTFPLLGLVATAAVVAALGVPSIAGSPQAGTEAMTGTAALAGIRYGMVAMLVLPQCLLTPTNSVVATVDVAERYFGDGARRVTARGLLFSIGIGNLLAAAVGGLPFCHGSGGLTAQVKGGARHWRANLVIGLTLLGLAIVAVLGHRVSLVLSPAVIGTLLFTVGYFHLRLAAPSWRDRRTRLQILGMGIATLLTWNLVWTFGIGAVIWLAQHFWTRSLPVPKRGEQTYA